MISDAKCAENWVRREEFCYLYVDTHLSWQHASNYCTGKGGNLASIHDKEENDFIWSKFLLTFVFHIFIQCSSEHKSVNEINDLKRSKHNNNVN